MMEHNHEARSMTFVSSLLLVVMVGAGIALLTVPEAGMRVRKRIRRVTGELRDFAGDHWDDLAEDVKDRVDAAVWGARKRLLAKRDT